MMREIFNDIIRQENMTPDAWRKVRFKGRDAARPENDRPRCMLAMSHKVFSTLLYTKRLYSKLDNDNPPTRGGLAALFKF